MNGQATRASIPLWFWAIAIAGLIWNIFGVVQFVGQVTQTDAAMMGAGMTAEQVAVYAALPVWMDIVFAIGTVGGVVGCCLLLIRNRLAVPVFAVSFAAYIVLFIGDIIHGVFAAFGSSQVIILLTVVIIAAGLFLVAHRLRSQGILG